MKLEYHLKTELLILASLIAFSPLTGGQTIDWIAYNDHRPTSPPGVNGWYTETNVTTYDFYNTPSGGHLTNFDAGDGLEAMVVVTRSSSGVRDLGSCERPLTGTPAYEIFHGIVDPGGSGIVAVEPNGWMMLTFTNLDLSKRYAFYGTALRGGNYFDRWSVCTITNATSYSEAHSGIGGSNVITQASFPASSLGPNQVAWCSGENRAAGDVVGWENIQPGPDGTFSIISQMYRGPVPSGQNTAGPSYSYALSVFVMAELDVVPTPITILEQPPQETTVMELLPLSIGVTVQGSSPAFQWYKEGVGPVSGANGRVYSLASASLSDSGTYFVVVTNSFGVVTSTVANVTVEADNSPPKVIRISPRVNPISLDVEFSEPVMIATAQDPRNYTIGGIRPLVVTVAASGTSVTLSLAAPLAFGNTNTLTLRNISDRASTPNVMPLTEIPVRAPVLSYGFLRADYYLGIIWHYVAALTSSPKFPDLYDQTFYRTNSTALSNFGDNYGLRLWGFFIPPTNGNYTFYVRSDDESEVYLSSDGNPANKILVASQTGSGRPYDDANGYPRFSTVQGLIAGRLYYFEALLKEGGGEDYLTVVYKAEGEPAPVNNTPSVTPLPSSVLACYADAEGVFLDLTQQPTGTNLLEQQRATFTISTSLFPPELASYALYQWQGSAQGGPYTNIAGANFPSYTTPPLVLADNGTKFICVVTVPGATITSSSASVTVSSLSPQIVNLTRTNNGTNVTFSFSTRQGFLYVVEYTDLLGPASWQPLSALLGTGNELTISTSITRSSTRFFRIKVQ